MNFISSNRNSSRNVHYERFIKSIAEGRRNLMTGIELDEKSGDTDRDRATKISACEHYKKGMDEFKTALSINIMDIPEERRSEVRETKEKIQGNLNSAQDRFLQLTDKLCGKKTAPVVASHPSTSSPSRGRAAQVRAVANRPSGMPSPRHSSLVPPHPAPESFAFCRKLTRSLERIYDDCGRPRAVKENVPVCKRQPRAPVESSVKPVTEKRVLIESRKNNCGPASVSTCRAPTREQMLRKVDPKFGNALLDEMLDRTGVTLRDVYGCESAKQALEEAVILPALNPSLFCGLRQPVKGILLFGPPGNGKTLLAKAVASESGQVFFNISAASLTSKWVGDGEKTVRCLFQIARNAQPCIIFIDEIDSILCERSEKEQESSRRMKTEFLIQLDGASSNASDRILVIGATNRPQELDDAVLRRFPKRVMLGLPDEKTRYALIMNTLEKHKASDGLRDSDIRWIASRTEGYSNSDLVALCKEAAMVPIRNLDRKKLATASEAKLRNIMVRDFEEALRVIRPSTNAKQLERMYDFATEAGQIK